MGFVSARILTPAQDGVNGYVNVTAADGTPVAIRITGEIIDRDIREPLITTIEITGRQLADLPPSTPGLEDTPDDPRYQAIFTALIRAIPPIHAAWRLRALAGTGATGVIEEPKAPEVVAALPVITPDVLAAVTQYGG